MKTKKLEDNFPEKIPESSHKASGKFALTYPTTGPRAGQCPQTRIVPSIVGHVFGGDR
jgi:hypothetical protein